MRKISLLILVAIFCTFISCTKEKSNPKTDPKPEPPVVTVDADATKFIEIAKIIDSAQKQSIQVLVKQLKDSALWLKFTAIYPMAGGTATSTKLNLKDPRDLDEAYRLTYHGNPVIASTGVLFPTSDDYADSHLYDSTMVYNDNSISYFSRTQNSISGYDMGCDDNTAPYNQMTIYNENNATDYFGFYRYGYMPENTKGLFMVSITSSNLIWFENGIPKLLQDSEPRNEFTGHPMIIGYCQNAKFGGQRECSFSTIGKGLTEKEGLTFYNIVTNFQNALKR